MDEDELRRRIDMHLERSAAQTARGDRILAWNARAFDDLSSFLHDQTLALRALTRKIDRHTDEMVAEMRAGREALLRVIDRMDRLDGRAGEGAPG